MSEFEEFDGIVSLNSLQIRLPASFYSAIKEYCRLTDTPIHQWINDEIILATESLELGPATSAFIDRYHLRNLTTEKRHALIQRDRRFKLTEEDLGESE